MGSRSFYIYRCEPSSEADKVKEYLSAQHLGVTDVKLASHPNSKYRSFIVTVSSRKDFEELISGVHLPEDVLVRRYFRPRQDMQAASNGKTWYSNQLAELDAISSVAVLSSSAPIDKTSGPSSSVSLPATDELMTASQMTGENNKD